MTAQTDRQTTPTAASPVPSYRRALVGILARLDPDDLHPARLAGPHAWHPWQLTTRPPNPADLRLVLPPRYPNQRAGHLLDHLAGRLDQPIWPPQPALTIRRNRHVLHARDTTGWHATIRIDTASNEISDTHGRGAVVDRDGWPILNELDALNDRCNHINPDHPTSQDFADLANWVRAAAARPADTRRVATPLDRLLHHQATATPQTASRLATIIMAALPADCTVDADALGHLHHQLQHARTATASRPRRR
jgi:hypothetical protein